MDHRPYRALALYAADAATKLNLGTTLSLDWAWGNDVVVINVRIVTYCNLWERQEGQAAALGRGIWLAGKA